MTPSTSPTHERDLFAIVLAGGSGTRFWPASRSSRPKQFLPIGSDRPLIVQTVERVRDLVPTERVLVVTARDQAPLVRECLPELPAENVLEEPCARNTAACAAWAALEVERRHAGSLQLVLPADHVIAPVERFAATIRAGAEEARESGGLLTFGVRPTHPATGYGYIETGDEIARRGGLAVDAVRRFVEKPDRARAEEFLATGRFLWNAGIFLWRGADAIAGLAEHANDVLDPLRGVVAGSASVDDVYPKLRSAPIDVALMEKARDVKTLPIDYTWSDVGSWTALTDLALPDEDGNWTNLSGGARLVAVDAKGCIVHGEAREVIAVVGADDLVVVRSGDATLVCPRERAQDVREVVARLKALPDGDAFL
ncbi:MAG: sugar phosphate nucleotidyltransferase [Planctomycetota bacterium]